MEPATDCTVDKTKETAPKVNVIHKSVPVDKDVRGVPITNSAGEPYNPPITKKIIERELFTVGDLADALNRRGYICNRDTVSNFINKHEIQPVRRIGHYRVFDRVALDLLRSWLKKRGKMRA